MKKIPRVTLITIQYCSKHKRVVQANIPCPDCLRDRILKGGKQSG